MESDKMKEIMEGMNCQDMMSKMSKIMPDMMKGGMANWCGLMSEENIENMMNRCQAMFKEKEE